MVIHQSTSMSIRKSRNIVLQQSRVRYTIKQSQQYMSELCEKLSSFEPFNNTVSPNDCVDRLIAHRITSKFHIDDGKESGRLQAAAFAKYIDYDNNLPIITSDTLLHPNLKSAKAFLYRMFKDFSVDFSSGDFSVTPGETFISNRGEVSITSKLFDKTHWTVTANCLDDACVFIYNNAAFKRAARQHIGHITRRNKRKLYLKFRHTADVGFHIFKYLLIQNVLTIVDGARASTVPKSNEKRRFINVEAMFSVIVQRFIASEILKALSSFGNCLENTKVEFEHDVTGVFKHEISAQKHHGNIIKDNRFSTIDFSNASDSVLNEAVNGLFPRQVSDILFRTRSHYVAIEGELHEPKKLSSMGNGFTFEVMTSLLYAIGKSFSNDVRVYGDDVIIPNEFAHQFVSVCKLIGFNVNEDKTFINSFFRESCGYFYSDHIGDYITSFDFNQILSMSDVIITCNKLTVILESGQVSHSLYNTLLFTRDQIAALAHASRKGPLPPSEGLQRKFLAMYIFDEGYEKKQRRSKELRHLRQFYIERNEWYFTSCQIARPDMSLVYIPFFIPSKSSHMFANVEKLKILLPALYSGKRLNATIRGKGRWVDLPAFVSRDGTLTLISNLISSREIWVNRLEGVCLGHQRV